MSDDSSGSFIFSWPFIIGAIVVYNLFFSDDDADIKKVESVDSETPAIVETVDPTNKIDETVNKIKKEMKESVVIQEVAEKLTKAKDELFGPWPDQKDEEVKDPPKEEAPILRADNEKESPKEDVKIAPPIIKSKPTREMKPL